MFVIECKLELQFKKEFEQCLYLVFFVSFLALNLLDFVHDWKSNEEGLINLLFILDELIKAKTMK